MKYYHIDVFSHYLFLWTTTILVSFYTTPRYHSASVKFCISYSYDMLLPVFIRYYHTWCIFAPPEGTPVLRCDYFFCLYRILLYFSVIFQSGLGQRGMEGVGGGRHKSWLTHTLNISHLNVSTRTFCYLNNQLSHHLPLLVTGHKCLFGKPT